MKFVGEIIAQGNSFQPLKMASQLLFAIERRSVLWTFYLSFTNPPGGSKPTSPALFTRAPKRNGERPQLRGQEGELEIVEMNFCFVKWPPKFRPAGGALAFTPSRLRICGSEVRISPHGRSLGSPNTAGKHGVLAFSSFCKIA